MYYVYILQSIKNPEHFYVGSTNDLKRRFKEHNSGNSIHTNKFKPWALRVYIAFDTEEKAQQFELFLKTGNGRVFQKKIFLTSPQAFIPRDSAWHIKNQTVQMDGSFYFNTK